MLLFACASLCVSMFANFRNKTMFAYDLHYVPLRKQISRILTKVLFGLITTVSRVETSNYFPTMCNKEHDFLRCRQRAKNFFPHNLDASRYATGN